MDKVRVLHVVSSLWSGGVAVLLKNYYSFFDKEKVQFDFLVSTPTKGMTEAFFENEGCKIYHLKGNRRVFKNFFATIKIVKKNKYRIVHIHHNDVSFAQLFAAFLGGAKVRIAHSHDALTLKGFQRIKRYFYCKLTKLFSNYHFACSESAGIYLFGKRGIKKKNYFYIRNAIDLDKYIFRKNVRESIRTQYNCLDSFVIGNVGRLCAQKNQLFLLDIFDALLKKNSNSLLFLIGKGEDEVAIKNKIHDLNIDNKVVMISVTDRIQDYLSSFDAFVFPSTHEGLGLALLEAEASDLYCFISDKIPPEPILTNKVHVISLKDDANTWADIIYNNTKTDRVSSISTTIKELFDIKKESSFLQKWYLEHSKQ